MRRKNVYTKGVWWKQFKESLLTDLLKLCSIYSTLWRLLRVLRSSPTSLFMMAFSLFELERKMSCDLEYENVNERHN